MNFDTRHIIKYLEGKLSEEESRKIEQRMEEDEDFQESVEGLKNMVKSKGAEKTQEWLEGMRHRFDQARSQRTQRGRKVVKFPTRLAAVAAVALILIIIGLYYYTASSTPNYSFDLKDGGLPVVMSAESDNLMDAAMNAYKQEDYQECLDSLTEYEEKFDSNDTTSYYRAVNLKALGKYNKALPLFQQDYQSKMLKDKAEYQAAMCLLYLGRKDDALTVFRKIARDNEHLMQTKAKEARAKLE